MVHGEPAWQLLCEPVAKNINTMEHWFLVKDSDLLLHGLGMESPAIQTATLLTVPQEEQVKEEPQLTYPV